MRTFSCAFIFDALFSEEKAPAPASLNGKGAFSPFKKDNRWNY